MPGKHLELNLRAFIGYLVAAQCRASPLKSTCIGVAVGNTSERTSRRIRCRMASGSTRVAAKVDSGCVKMCNLRYLARSATTAPHRSSSLSARDRFDIVHRFGQRSQGLLQARHRVHGWCGAMTELVVCIVHDHFSKILGISIVRHCGQFRRTPRRANFSVLTQCLNSGCGDVSRHSLHRSSRRTPPWCAAGS